MKGVTSTANGNGSYVYDGNGRRVKKVWSPDGQPTVTTYYVYDALGQLATEISDQLPSNTGTLYSFTDMLGSVRAITSQGGLLTECYDYLPFGRMLSSSDNGRGDSGCYPADPDTQLSSREPQKFTGKERDNETGLDYFGARYLSAAQGRFTSPDPVMLTSERLYDPQRINLYAYVRNNSLNLIDPNGLDITCNGTNCGKYLAYLQWNVTFCIDMEEGKIIFLGGKPNREDLNELDQAFYDAIEDPDHHVKITAVGGREEAYFLAKANDKRGSQTINYWQLREFLTQIGGLTAAGVTGHETLEGFYRFMYSKQISAHDQAIAMGFTGLIDLGPVESQDIFTNNQLTGFSKLYKIEGTNLKYQVQFAPMFPVSKDDHLTDKLGYRTPASPVKVELIK
jgi:RHS repeat-associated protein